MRGPKRILVYRIGQIGDMVIALPAIWAIRQHCPDAYMALLGDAHRQSDIVSSRCVLPESEIFNGWLSYPARAIGSGARAILGTLPMLRRLQFDTLVYLVPS